MGGRDKPGHDDNENGMIVAMDRRAAIVGGAALAGTAMSARAAADPLSGAALYADVRAYSDLGEHRTGAPGDAATTGWMIKALTDAGYDAFAQSFAYPVFEPTRCDLTLGGRTIEGFPYWTPKAAPPGGVSGPLSTVGGAGKVALVVLPSTAGAGLKSPPPAPIAAAANSGAVAVVVVTEGPLGELAAFNRNPKAAPWPVPVLFVAGREAAVLKAAAQAGETATVRLEGRSMQRQVSNVVARRVRPGKPTVISTPKSGWFHCAGERGSGIAIWLGLARWLATTDRNVILVAATGHEFDGYGGERFAETLAPKPADTRLWVAIGANVAAYDFALVDGKITRQAGPPSARILACSDALVPVAAKAFAGQPGYEKPSDIEQSKPPGEVAHFQELGYAPLVGMVAANPLHHTRRDLADVTGPAVLEPVARGLAAIIAAV
jgi:hypothetical protein